MTTPNAPAYTPDLSKIKQLWEWQPIHPSEKYLITGLALLLPVILIVSMWFEFGRKNQFPVKGRVCRPS